jgi:hypothetical protein
LGSGYIRRPRPHCRPYDVTQPEDPDDCSRRPPRYSVRTVQYRYSIRTVQYMYMYMYSTCIVLVQVQVQVQVKVEVIGIGIGIGV